MICHTADNSYLLFLKQQPTIAEFLLRARVRQGTYAEELMLQVYREIFVYSLELRRQFRMYYEIEYTTFSRFSTAFANIPDSVKPKLNAFYKRYELIIAYRGVPSYLQGDDGLALLSRLLKLKALQ